MSEDPHKLDRRRLRFRAWHRGTRELDLLMGSYADAKLADMTAEQLRAFEDILNAPDPDVFSWITAGAEPGAHIDKTIIDELRALTLTPRDYANKT